MFCGSCTCNTPRRSLRKCPSCSKRVCDGCMANHMGCRKRDERAEDRPKRFGKLWCVISLTGLVGGMNE